MESEWTLNWEASNKPYIKANPKVEKVLERRRVDKGYIYELRLKDGSFEVRLEVNGNLYKSAGYKSGTEAVKSYRRLRDNLVASRGGKETYKTVEIEPTGKPKAAKKSPAKTAKKAAKK